MSKPFEIILQQIVIGFGDPKGIDAVLLRLTNGLGKDHPDVVGMGMHVDELIIGHLEGFKKELLHNTEGEFYHLNTAPFVNEYLRYFDVKPTGPDVMKYICAFGEAFERYAGSLGERHLVTAVIRGLTVRLLRNAAVMSNSQKAVPPDVMTAKVFKVCHDADRCREIMGRYGPYMLFKTWALA